MNTMQDVKIYAEQGLRELVIRNGAATEPVRSKGVTYSGAIDSPLRFLSARSGIDKAEAIVIVDVEEGKITLLTHEHTKEAEGHTVIGELTENSDLAAWKINSPAVWSLKDFTSLVKFNRQMFLDPNEHRNLLEKLSTFTVSLDAKAESTTVKTNERKGFDKKVVHGLPESFAMKAPLFIADKEQTFTVEILVDLRGENPAIWTESVQLHELFKIRRVEALKEVLNAPEFQGIAVIHQ